MNEVVFEGVTKVLGGRRVLDELSFEVPLGKMTFLIGRSGEGKSVTLKHIMGLLAPDSGEIYVEGQKLKALSKKEWDTLRSSMGVLFQHAALFDHLRVWENIALPLIEHGWSKRDCRERVDLLLNLWNLNSLAHRFPKELAMGESKRVGLARALALKPRLLLYDEPTTGLDPLTTKMVDQILSTPHRHDSTLTSIVISHDLEAALNVADHIIFLYQGHAIYAGAPELFLKTNHPVVRQFFAGEAYGPMTRG
jgi:phospholipid/cholesterol/gamma-HCH transport system ATP-binding protein